MCNKLANGNYANGIMAGSGARAGTHGPQSRGGYLQNSVWITPDPLTEERQILGGGKINVESLLLLEARPCAGESDAEIVAGAWDFARLNRRYARHLKILNDRRALQSEICHPQSSEAWRATAEREAWQRGD